MVVWEKDKLYQHVFGGSAESWKEQQQIPVDGAAAAGPLVGGSDPGGVSRRLVLPLHQQQVATFTNQERGIF